MALDNAVGPRLQRHVPHPVSGGAVVGDHGDRRQVGALVLFGPTDDWALVLFGLDKAALQALFGRHHRVVDKELGSVANICNVRVQSGALLLGWVITGR